MGTFTESEAEAELAPSVAVTVADCGVFDMAAVAERLAAEAPAPTETDAGTDRAEVFVLLNVTVAPPDGAAWFKVTVQVEVVPEFRVVGEQVRLVTDAPRFAELLPGTGKFAEASSITRTQSLASGAVKALEPLFGKLPMSDAAPVLGLYHHALAVELEDVIFDILIVLAVAFPSER